MIHILTEDSGNGFEFCKLIKSLYFDTESINLEMETLNGVWGLQQKIQKKIEAVDKNDTIIIVYDDIVDNPIISRNIDEAQVYIEEHDLSDKIFWIPTYSFEIELLQIIGFEFFANSEKYAIYFKKLRDNFIKNKSISELTMISKKESIFIGMYDKERSEKQKVRVYTQLSKDDFERAITIESISKAIMTEVFKYEAPLKASDFVDKPMGGKDGRNCWKNNCCNKNRRCKNRGIDIDRIIEKQRTEATVYKGLQAV